MTIIITKQNAEFFKEKMKAKSLNIVDQTENTLHVKLSVNRFNKLVNEIRLLGLNPYAVMAW
jgi:hypothetical protein